MKEAEGRCPQLEKMAAEDGNPVWDMVCQAQSRDDDEEM